MSTLLRVLGFAILISGIILIWGCSDEKNTQPVVNHAPNVPSNPSPADGITGIDTALTLSWQCSDPDGDSLLYDFYLGFLQELVVVDSNLASPTYQVAHLEVSRVYYWNVVAHDARHLETSSPIWSFGTVPGAERIVFNSQGTAGYRMLMMNADGSNMHIIGDTTEMGDHNPSISYDGSKIAFNRMAYGMYNHIWTMNCDGSNRFEVNHEDLEEACCPMFSPDGSQIAFLVGQGSVLPCAIYIVNSSDGVAHAISDYIVGAEGFRLSWSPDGSRIAFESDSLYWNGRGICVINSDGSGFQRLTADSTQNCDPAWSHDGTKFAFSRHETDFGSNTYQIYVMNADGSNPQNITNSTTYERFPCWSPDDSQIAYSSYRDENYDIYVMNADGSNQHRITDNPGNDWGASWGSYHR